MSATVEIFSAAAGLRVFIHCLRGRQQMPNLCDKPEEHVPCLHEQAFAGSVQREAMPWMLKGNRYR